MKDPSLLDLSFQYGIDLKVLVKIEVTQNMFLPGRPFVVHNFWISRRFWLLGGNGVKIRKKIIQNTDHKNKTNLVSALRQTAGALRVYSWRIARARALRRATRKIGQACEILCEHVCYCGDP